MTGPYTVVNCEGNTSVIVSLINKLRPSLLPIIQDVKSATSSPAYKAFFKDPSFAPFVSALFTNVSLGVPRTPPGEYSVLGAPTFVCVTAPEQVTFNTEIGRRDAYNECIENPKEVAKYIGAIHPIPYIILCPSLFTRNIAPVPPPNTCLPIRHSTYISRFHGNGQSFRMYQMWSLLDMLVNYYILTSTGNIDLTVYQNDVNKCFRQTAEKSILNANNYVYYAASIYGKCRNFPTHTHTHHDDGRELLEVDLTDPSHNGADDEGPTAVEFIDVDLDFVVKNTTGQP